VIILSPLKTNSEQNIPTNSRIPNSLSREFHMFLQTLADIDTIRSKYVTVLKR